MMLKVRHSLACAGLAWGLVSGAVLGGEESSPLMDRPSCPGNYRLPIASWAQPSNTPHYDGGYVGGGCLFRGDARHPDEGTWGWDYEGCFFSRRVWLDWCHCRPHHGGVSAYKTDGPQLHHKESTD